MHQENPQLLKLCVCFWEIPSNLYYRRWFLYILFSRYSEKEYSNEHETNRFESGRKGDDPKTDAENRAVQRILLQEQYRPWRTRLGTGMSGGDDQSNKEHHKSGTGSADLQDAEEDSRFGEKERTIDESE